MTGTAVPTARGSVGEVFLVFLRLGLTSFGGPIAHLGYFREEFVVRRRWLDDHAYADLVALCQFLPGPASSQVAIAVGLGRAGYPGAAASWLGFTMPSAIALVLFAFGAASLVDALGGGWLQGLKTVAVAIVAQAIWGMARALTPDLKRAAVAVLALCVCIAVPSAWGQVGAIALGAAIGAIALSGSTTTAGRIPVEVGHGVAVACLVLFFLLLVGLPLVAGADGAITLFDKFYRAGALVFGGGHVVLPLLQAEVVGPGWVDKETFIAGYGAAQAVPGPLFTFAAYLGASMKVWPSGLLGAAVALVAIFAPCVLLVVGALPFWASLAARPGLRAALAGINAAVVGLLGAAFYDPVWTAGVPSGFHFALAVAAFVALEMGKVPAWLVVVVAALVGAGIPMLAR